MSPTYPREIIMACAKKGHKYGVTNSDGRVVSTHTSIWAAKQGAHERGPGHHVVIRNGNLWVRI